MKYSDIYNDILTLAQITGTSATNTVKRGVQRTLDRVAGYTFWPFYLTHGFFTTIAPYTTGTVNLTLGSTAVVGVGTTWTAAMVGRRIRFGSETAYYDIAAFVSATSITLTQPYQATSNNGATYSLYLDEYLLKANVDSLSTMKQIETGFLLLEVFSGDFEKYLPTGTAQADPSWLVVRGRDNNSSTTGTVTATAGGTTITGAGTSWTSVSGLSDGSRVMIGANVYTVKSVDSDTQLTIYGTIGSSVSGSAYTIYLQNIRVQLYQIPSQSRNIYYDYYRKPVPLENDGDEPDLPPAFHWLLVSGGMKEAWIYKGDEVRTRGAETEFMNGLQKMKEHYVSRTKLFQRKSQTAYILRRGPRYPAQFDVRVSAP